MMKYLGDVLRNRLLLATMTTNLMSSEEISLSSEIGYHGYQCYYSHMTTRKSDKKHIVVVKCERILSARDKEVEDKKSVCIKCLCMDLIGW